MFPSIRRVHWLLEGKMDRHQKHAFVSEFREVLSKHSLIVITQQTGLSVSESEDLRQKVRAEGGHFKIVKNTFLRLCLEQRSEGKLLPHLKGPTGIAYSEDPLAAAKAVASFAKANDKIKILAGALTEDFVDAAGLKQLASLPPLDVLRAKMAGLLLLPFQKVAAQIAAPGTSLARVCGAYAQKDS